MRAISQALLAIALTLSTKSSAEELTKGGLGFRIQDPDKAPAFRHGDYSSSM